MKTPEVCKNKQNLESESQQYRQTKPSHTLSLPSQTPHPLHLLYHPCIEDFRLSMRRLSLACLWLNFGCLEPHQFLRYFHPDFQDSRKGENVESFRTWWWCNWCFFVHLNHEQHCERQYFSKSNCTTQNPHLSKVPFLFFGHLVLCASNEFFVAILFICISL